MKTESLNQTGPAVALKIAYLAVTQILNYSHKQLREKTGWDYGTLRKIRDGRLGQKSPVKYYLNVLVQLLTKAMDESLRNDGATKAILIKNDLAAIGCELCNQHLPRLTNEGQ